jgi:leucyl aminopeptidase (aminopeptidase T)
LGLRGIVPTDKAAVPALAEAASAALDCVGVDKDDLVLIVSNQPQRVIADALEAAAQGRAGGVSSITYPELSRDGEEPPEFVTAAMAGATAIFAPTTFSLSHTGARMAATSNGARIATMPSITPEIFARAMPVDYVELGLAGARIAGCLTAASTCRITTPAGTDAVLDLTGRTAISDDGNISGPAAWGNLPAGEGFIAPLEDRGEGMIVYDGALAGHGLLEEPVRLRLESGRVTGAAGAAGAWLLETLDAGGPDGRAIAEIGIGTNPAAVLSGNILEDEKVIGTVHLAFGMSASIGGENFASVHIDGMMLTPTVELDGQLLMRDGILV